MKKGLIVNIAAGIMLAAVGIPSFTSQDAAAALQDKSYKVKIVYFYPADYKYDQRYVNAIDPFVKDIQKWYADQLGGTAFYTDPVVVIKGQKNTADYGAAQPTWADVESELGVQCGGGNKTVTLIFLARPLQWGNGRSCGPWYSGGTNNGDVTVSETTFDAQIVGIVTGTCPNGYLLGDWRCSVTAAKGGIAHELGHAFTLPHPLSCDVTAYAYCNNTVMWSWWLEGRPTLGLLDLNFAPEKQTLNSSAWFWYRLPKRSK